MTPIEWVTVARTLWAHRGKIIAVLAALVPVAVTITLILLTSLFGGGMAPPTADAALRDPTCQEQMAAQGLTTDRGVTFGAGPTNNGKAIIAAGLKMGIPEKGIIVGLATAMQESGMRNLANPKVPESLRIPNEGLGHDHLSVGPFQQQPWWGTIRDLMNPFVSATKFYAALLKVGGWESMAPTEAAQAVQRSAFPDAYADDVPAAAMFYRQHLAAVQETTGETASSASTSAQDLCAGTKPTSAQTTFVLSKLPQGKSSEQGLQRYTILANRAVSAAFPEVSSIGGYRPDALRWHPEGLALDIMTTPNPLSPNQVKLGFRILAFLMKNAKALGVDHAIYRQRIYYPSGYSEPMGSLGSITADHYDHVHLATKGGGYP